MLYKINQAPSEKQVGETEEVVLAGRLLSASHHLMVIVSSCAHWYDKPRPSIPSPSDSHFVTEILFLHNIVFCA